MAILVAAALGGCGGEQGAANPEGIIDALADDGYLVDEVDSVSFFEPRPETSLVVDVAGGEEGAVVGVEFYGDSDDAAKAAKKYGEIDGATVQTDGSIVFSGLPPVEAPAVREIAAAATD